MRQTSPLRACRLVAVLLFILVLAGCAAHRPGTPRLVARPEWKRHFDAAGASGTMALQKDGASNISVFNAKRAATSYLPASTFKILNTLIALETRSVAGPDELFRYDGVPRAMAAWNADLTLRQAFAVSCVPIYQEIARRIGPNCMARYVTAARYGNADISGGIDLFWLQGGLRISALEQIDFLARLNRRELPFSANTITTTLDVMVVETTPDYILRAKTGWAARVSPGIGWYVGMVTRGAETWYFALNIDINTPEQAPAREAIARAILRSEGIL